MRKAREASARAPFSRCAPCSRHACRNTRWWRLPSRQELIAADCASFHVGSDTPTVPNDADGRYDFQALERCAKKLKDSSLRFAAERAISVVAHDTLVYSTVIETIDALRKAEDGTVLFPEVTLAAFAPHK